MQRSAHHVGAQLSSDGSVAFQPQYHVHSPSLPTNPLSTEQCQKFISYLQSQLQGHQMITESPQASSSTGSSDFNVSFSGMFSLTPFVASCSKSESLWLINTGATHHVCCSASQLQSLTNLTNAFITLPNSQKVLISSIGTIQVTPTLTLHSVLHVPSFSYNLLSISSLTSSSNCLVSFTHAHCLIQDASKGIQIGMSRRVGNLYVLDHAPASVSFSSISSVIGSDIWHNRLSHLGPKKLSIFSSSLPMKTVPSKVCEICPISKQKRLGFTSSDHIADSIFDLIHCDIWGPFNPVTVYGHNIF